MSVKEFLHLSKNYFKKGKKSSVSSYLFMFLSIFLFIISSTTTRTLNKFLEDNIDKNYDYRTLYVHGRGEHTPDEMREIFRDIDHIESIYDSDYFIFNAKIDEFINDNLDGGVQLTINDEEIIPNIVVGRALSDRGEIVCPQTFVPDSNIEGRVDLKKTHSIDMNSRIGEEIIISFNLHDYSYDVPKIVERSNHSFILVGTYDHELNYNQPNNCFILSSDLSNLVKIKKDNYVNSSDTSNNFILILDNAQNMEKVTRELEKLGFYVIPKIEINLILSEAISFMGSYLSLISLLIALTMILISNISRVEENANEIGLLKSLGFESKDIRLIFILQTLVMTIIIFVISILSLSIVVLLSRVYLSTASIHFATFKVSLSLKDIMIVFGYSVVVPFCVNFLLLLRIVKIDSTILLRR